jgi:hypothetical protein
MSCANRPASSRIGSTSSISTPFELEYLVEPCGVAKAEFDIVEWCVVVRHGYVLRAKNLADSADKSRPARISDIGRFGLYHKEVIQRGGAQRKRWLTDRKDDRVDYQGLVKTTG